MFIEGNCSKFEPSTLKRPSLYITIHQSLGEYMFVSGILSLNRSDPHLDPGLVKGSYKPFASGLTRSLGDENDHHGY